MDKEIDMALLGPCLGAAVALVASTEPLSNKHSDYAFQRVSDAAFALYFEMKKRADAYNAQFNSKEG